MKGFKVKKLAAVAAGVALVGTALAPLALGAAMSNADKLTRADLVNASGSPVVNVVVGSNNAEVSDWAWAGNIAAKVAQLASVEKQVTVSGGGTVNAADATVDFTIGGTVTKKGSKTYFNNLLSTAQETNFNAQTVTNSTIPSLKYNSAKSYTVNGTTKNVTMQEQVVLTINPEFDETITNKALTGVITTGNLLYRVDLGSGVPAVENPGSANSPGPKFTDDTNDDVRIPFFGKEYLVQESDSTSSPTRVILIDAGGEKVYKEGDELANLKGKDGKLYKVVVGSGVTVSSIAKINLTLVDSEGKEVTRVTSAAGDVTFYGPTGNPVLETLVNIKEIQSKSTEGGGTIYNPVILLGSNRVELRNGEGYPYDSTKTSDQYKWTVALTFSSDNNYLTRIDVKNSSQNQWTGAGALRMGGQASLPGDPAYGTISLLGLQLPEFTGVSKTERLTTVVVGNQKLIYRDTTNEADHVIPFYFLLQGASNGSKNLTFSFDSKTFYVDVNLETRDANKNPNNDLNFSDSSGMFNGVLVLDVNRQQTSATIAYRDMNGLDYIDSNLGPVQGQGTVRIGGQEFVLADGNTDINNIGGRLGIRADGNISFKTGSGSAPFLNFYYSDNNVSARRDHNAFIFSNVVTPGQSANLSSPISGVRLSGASDVNANYVILVNETSTGLVANIWLMLAYQTFVTTYNKRVTVEGTDQRENGAVDVNKPYYEPNSSQLPTDYNGGTQYSVNNYKVAQFTVEEDQEVATGIKDMNLFVDTTTGNGNLLVLPNNQLSTYSSEVLYDENALGGTGGVTFRVSEGQSQYPSVGYSDYGSKIIVKDHVLTLVMPENRPQFEVLVEGRESTSEASGGKSFTGVKKGETKTTDAGTKVTLDKVSVGETTVEGAVATPSTYRETVPVGRLVYSDRDAPSGKPMVKVGGWKVNRAVSADAVLSDGSALSSKVTAAGDYVVDLGANGDVLVVGYTAADTQKAAEALIAALDGLTQPKA